MSNIWLASIIVFYFMSALAHYLPSFHPLIGLLYIALAVAHVGEYLKLGHEIDELDDEVESKKK